MLNLLFHRAARNQLVDEHRFLLADAIGAVGGLVFCRWVPPRIVMNHRVCFRQVEAHATGLQADQKNLTLAALKFFYWRASIAGLSGQQGVGHTAFVQFIFDQRQHRSELREQQNPPPFLKQLFEHFHQAVEFARRTATCRQGGVVDQA